LAGLRAELDAVKAKLAECVPMLAETQRELRDVRREQRDTEWELLNLYRITGRKPSDALVHRVDDTPGDR